MSLLAALILVLYVLNPYFLFIFFSIFVLILLRHCVRITLKN